MPIIKNWNEIDNWTYKIYKCIYKSNWLVDTIVIYTAWIRYANDGGKWQFIG